MIDKGLVTGMKEQAVELIVGTDTVYVHTNITKLEPTEEGQAELYQYNEVQYEKDEYIKLISEKNAAVEKQVTDTQLALCEVYELIG